MKKLLIILTLMLSLNVSAQYFINVNSERCFLLYEQSDVLSQFVVYVVLEAGEDNSDVTKILDKWKTYSKQDKSDIVQYWSYTGKRIESERMDISEIEFEKPKKNEKPLDKNRK